MDSGTDISLKSIYGTGYDNVWVSGWINIDGDYRTVLLHFDGVEWRTIVEYYPGFGSDANPDSTSGYIWGVYVQNSDSVLVLSHTGLYKCPFEAQGEGRLIDESTEAYSSLMRDFNGTTENDLSLGGSFSRIIHYNGNSFFENDELYNIGYIYGMAVTDQMVVAVGDFTSTTRDMIIRGYR